MRAPDADTRRPPGCWKMFTRAFAARRELARFTTLTPFQLGQDGIHLRAGEEHPTLNGQGG